LAQSAAKLDSLEIGNISALAQRLAYWRAASAASSLISWRRM